MTNDEEEPGQDMTTPSSAGIPVSSALGKLLVRALGGPAEQVGGIAEDWLRDKRRMIRQERAERLARETDRVLKARGVDGPTRPVPLNVAFRIVENATLEDDDFLQDQWARLLATAMDPNRSPVKRSYVGILTQMEAIDVAVLDLVHEISRGEVAQTGEDESLVGAILQGVVKQLAIRFGITPYDADLALQNLSRLGCVNFGVSPSYEFPFPSSSTMMPGLSFGELAEPIKVRLTPLGMALVEACRP